MVTIYFRFEMRITQQSTVHMNSVASIEYNLFLLPGHYSILILGHY